MSKSQKDLDNHSNQCNPNNSNYWKSRGSERPDDWQDECNKPKSWANSNQKELDNHANNCNPDHVNYWKSRGLESGSPSNQAAAEMQQETSSSSNNDQGSSSSWGWIAAGVGAVAAGAFLAASIFNTDTAEPSEQRDADRRNARR